MRIRAKKYCVTRN